MSEKNKKIKKSIENFFNKIKEWDIEESPFYNKEWRIKRCLDFCDLLSKNDIDIFYTTYRHDGSLLIEIYDESKNKGVDFLFYEETEKYIRYLNKSDLVIDGDYCDDKLEEIVDWFKS